MSDVLKEQYPLSPYNQIGQRLADRLKQTGHECAFVVRAPGRVNLIGEHIDYNGYSVLPMALEQAVYLAVAFQTDDASMTLSSTDSEYEKVTIPISEMLSFGSAGPPSPLKWFHYVQCAFRGVADYMEKSGRQWRPPALLLLVGGAEFGGLWPASGLSSSSALVVASALAFLHASGILIERSELAQLCANCERYTGMQGGAMDQVASLMGAENKAILIEFRQPPIANPCPLPTNVVFVVAHCGVNARKAATSKYNERVSECRIASKILVQNSPNPSLKRDKPLCLIDAQTAWNVDTPGSMLKSKEGLSIVNKHLKPGITTRKDLIDDVFNDDVAVEQLLTPTTKCMQEFRLRDRAQHVYSEAERVCEFYRLCQSLDKQAAGDHVNAILDQVAHQLGVLMNDSHSSCAQLYNCSCPELDELIAVCRSAGALGSRLTGAGWGGSTVSLVPVEKVEQFIQTVRQQYYDRRQISASEKLIFVSKAGPPAGIMVSKQNLP